MTNCETTERVLSVETAVAARLLRASHISRPLAGWLGKPSSVGSCPFESVMVAAAVEDIIAKVSKDAEPWQRDEIRHASLWYAHALKQLYCGGSTGERWCTPELSNQLALAALLPLYRCLATRTLTQGWSESRNRLAEALVLRGLRLELGPEVGELLESALRGRAAPNDAVTEQFSIDVSVVANIAMDSATHVDGSLDELWAGEITPSTKAWLAQVDVSEFAPKYQPWAEPSLLWKLAGQVLADAPNMVLPRSWADKPAPWSSISKHWRKLQALLTGQHERPSRKNAGTPAAVTTDHNHQATAEAANQEPDLATQQGTTSAGLDAQAEIDKPTQNVEIRGPGDAEALVDATADLVEQSGIDAAIAEPKAATEQIEDTKSPSGGGSTFDESIAHSRMSIAEVHSHNDPLFVSALSRTISRCRNDQRSLSLATVVVRPESPNEQVDICRRCDDGLYLWQRKLITWLADYPGLEEAVSFVTSEGELLVTILDYDRNDTTAILRQGLLEVLTGEAIDEGSSLAPVEIPVKFHAGIATVTRVGAGFAPDQIIEPLRRCFTAATRIGSASIKSIEVY